MNEVVKQLDITDGIVVGHDGSRHAERALRWAAGWATRTGCRLHVVRTWVLSSAPRPESWRTTCIRRTTSSRISSARRSWPTRRTGSGPRRPSSSIR